MLSGIGPRFHLENLKIPVIQDLPVGDNFEDQPAYYNLEFTSNHTEPITSLQQLVKDYLNNFGPFTNPLNAQAVAFLQTKYAATKNVPDIQALLVASNNTNDFSQEVFNYNRETYKATLEKNEPNKTFSIYLYLLHPKSRGFFRLNSKNPFDYPRIDPRLLSDPNDEDIETLYQGIQLAQRMVRTAAFQKVDAKLKHEPLPACKRYAYLTKKFWYCQLRQLTTSSFNPVGTCKMGPNPKDSVVDSDLNVHGIRNLRVADTSVFPTSISGPPSIAASMIGEKVASFIRNPEFKGYGELKEKLQNLEERVKRSRLFERLVLQVPQKYTFSVDYDRII
ncbi:glucose dehydrogenase [FAD, quinone]-like [Photinus pyralis]|uniref:glucose dehydrogenase [FAD, quinone]-like n=1 Tax=Photinus pyralis TaxID=7054 RepID=UPI0012672AA1|nr:glucose dehydrogenase [FAD, quinone]-like [Photinus pyralis]